MPEAPLARERVRDCRTRAKILFLIGTLDVGGSETQLVELASRLDRDSFEAVVCTLTPGGVLESALRDRGIRLFSLLARRPRQTGQAFPAVLRAPVAAARLWRLIRRERPDVVHGVLAEAYVLGTFVARLARVRLVVASRRSLGHFKEHRTFFLWLERLADRMTDLFIANSDAVRRDTLAREPIDPSRIIVIHNGVDFERFDAAACLGTAARPLPVGSPRVLVVSNLRHYKGHEYFLRAWVDVLRQFPNAVALLAGGGPLRTRFDALADELGIRPAVRFLGIRQDVPALLAQADLFVHPSLEEGYSNAVLEAMAAGLPIVACAVGGNVEAIANGTTGLLVQPSDPAALAAAMCRMLADQNAAREMGARARAFVRARHDLPSVVSRYEVAYRHLLMAREPGTLGASLDAAERSGSEASQCAE